MAREIVTLRERHRMALQGMGVSARGFEFLDLVVNLGLVSERLGLSYGGSRKLIDRLVSAGLLHETTGQQRNRRFAYQPYLDLLNQ
jgi:hypothetical protein